MNLIAYIDGSCFGNPGKAGYGIVLKTEDGSVLHRVGRYIGEATNNIAEYAAMIGCLELAGRYPVKKITVFSDSQLLVRQICGEYTVKKEHLKKMHQCITDWLHHHSVDVSLQHISREQNNEADGLARKAVIQEADIEETENNPPG